MRVAAGLASVVALAGLLGGCGEESPSWGAVDTDTCGELDLTGLVGDAYPSLPAAEASADETSDGGSRGAVCLARADTPDGGRLVVQVELSSRSDGGKNSLYDLRDGGQVGLDGTIHEVDPSPVEGWWQEGVSVVATTSDTAPASASVGLTVRDRNLVVAVRVSDKRAGGASADVEADRDLADAILDAVPDVVPQT